MRLQSSELVLAPRSSRLEPRGAALSGPPRTARAPRTGSAAVPRRAVPCRAAVRCRRHRRAAARVVGETGPQRCAHDPTPSCALRARRGLRAPCRPTACSVPAVRLRSLGGVARRLPRRTHLRPTGRDPATHHAVASRQRSRRRTPSRSCRPVARVRRTRTRARPPRRRDGGCPAGASPRSVRAGVVPCHRREDGWPCAWPALHALARPHRPAVRGSVSTCRGHAECATLIAVAGCSPPPPPGFAVRVAEASGDLASGPPSAPRPNNPTDDGPG
jgi:hypothetical protein